MYIANRIGVKYTILIALILMTIGTGVDILIEYNFYFIILGQTIVILANNMIITLTGEICDRWFSTEERPMAVCFTSIAKYLSASLNLALPLLFIENDTKQLKSQIIVQTKYFTMFRVAAAIFLFFICMILFKEHPNKKQPNSKQET